MKVARIFIQFLVIALCLPLTNVSLASVVLDGSMGASGSVNGPNYNITANMGQQSGSNLFHSFLVFSIDSSETATFSGPPSVENIVARVTGGEVSSINGLLRSTINGADLYLINPAGIMFGPRAHIDLGGSFFVSTADYLGFEDAMKLYAMPVQGELLTSAAPSSFGFLDGPLGSIIVQGPGELPQQAAEGYRGLGVHPMETLSLIGGEVIIADGAYTLEENEEGASILTRLPYLAAPGGRIDIVAVGGAGEVLMTEEGPDTSSFDSMGNVSITGNVLITTSGKTTGDIYIRGGHFFLSGGEIHNTTLEPGEEGSVITQEPGEGGLVDIEVESAEIVGGAIIDVSTNDTAAGGTINIRVSGDFVLAGSDNGGMSSSLNVNSLLMEPVAGDAGEINLTAGSVTIADGAFITGYTQGGGSGGDVYIDSSGNVLIAGTSESGENVISGIYVNTLAEGDLGGDAGNLTINAKSLILENGGTLQSTTYGKGDGGTITLTADSILMHATDENHTGGAILVGTKSSSNGGDGGSLLITTNNLTMDNGSNIVASSEGPGAGGDIEIYVADTLHILGTEKTGFSSRIQATSRSMAINEQETQQNGITSSNTEDTKDAQEEPVVEYSHGGPGGNIYIEAGKILLEGGGAIIANSDCLNEIGSASDAGEIHIVAGEIIARGVNPYGETTDGLGSGIYSKSLGIRDKAGDAGTIIIEADSLTLENGGVIISSTNSWSSGGDITVDVTGDINISGDGKAGLIYDPREAQEQFIDKFGKESLHSGISGIYASSMDDVKESGDSGHIVISADNVNLSREGQVVASSHGGGAAGSIAITAADSMTMNSGSKISTSAILSGGGQIDLNVKNKLQLTDSSIETSVAMGEQSGGDITIDPHFVILNRSHISANADAGKGGNVSIVADHFIASADSAVTASSRTGIDGNVVIESPDVNLAASLANLPVQYLDASQWARTPCDRRSMENISRFEIRPADAVAAPLNDFRSAMPSARDQNIAGFVERMDYRGLLEALEQEENSLTQTVWMSYAFQEIGKLDDAAITLYEGRDLFEQSDDLYAKVLYLSQKGDLALVREETKAAISNLKQALALAKESQDPLLLGCVWNNLGNLRAVNKDPYGAVAAYKSSLENLKNASTGKGLVPLVEINLAREYSKSGNAISFGREIEGALAALQELNPSMSTAQDWVSLFSLANEEARLSSEFSDQLAVGLEQAATIAAEAGSDHLLSYSKGCLSLLYARNGKTQEAWAEVNQAIHYAQLSQSSGLLFQWLRLLGGLSASQGLTDQAVLAYKQAVVTLGPIRLLYLNGYRDKDKRFDKDIRPVYLEMAALFLKNQDYLAEARDTMELLKRAELQNYFQDECFAARPWSPFSSSTLAEGTAMLYPISFPKGLSLLLITREGMKRYSVPVSKNELETVSHSFRQILENGGDDYWKDARQLYDWIIRPISDDLKAQGIDTLVVAPDGVLRLIPFGALYDGSHYLIETMAVSTVSAASLTDLESAPTNMRLALINGLTVEKDGFAPLPYVAKELQAIKSLMPGKVLMDKDFTLPNLENEINGQDYNIMHMASHAVFAGQPRNSFLLTYSGKLYVDELEQLVGTSKYRGQILDLLMLSACDTAMGDERASFGIAGMALSAGAKSIVATLWEADDEAASMLVEEFYKRFVNSNVSKAKALQDAQIKLIESDRFSNPTYWAAFTLIGSWK